MKWAKNVQLSAAELNSRNQSLLNLYSSQIEVAADSIINQSPSSGARRQALQWKIDAIPVMQTSLLNTDPVAAVVDTWAFLFQMSSYMDQPAIRNGFGDSQSIPSDVLKRMDSEIEQLVRTAAPSADISDIRARIRSWAEAHPIQAGLASRQSADAVIIRQVGNSDLGTLASLQALSEGLGDVTARLDSYNAYIPKQARWQAELLLNDLTRDPEVNTALSNFSVISNALEKTSSGMERMPELAAQARTTMLGDVEGQRLAAQAFLHQERLETLDSLTRERVAAVTDLRGERLAATEDLRQERQIVIDALHKEESIAVNDLQRITADSIKDFDVRSHKLIDHVFFRAVELVLLTLGVGFVLAWILLRRFAEKRS
jgi:hypothetical protein